MISYVSTIIEKEFQYLYVRECLCMRVFFCKNYNGIRQKLIVCYLLFLVLYLGYHKITYYATKKIKYLKKIINAFQIEQYVL